MDNAVCKYAPRCPFYNQLKMGSSVTAIRSVYCESKFEKCERYKLRESGMEVPKELWPDGYAG